MTHYAPGPPKSAGRSFDNERVDFIPATPAPRPAESAAPADWVIPRIATFDEHWVTATAGTGWPAYARVFHPLDIGPDAPRWADVAAVYGFELHGWSQWDLINGHPAVGWQTGRSSPGDPRVGHLETAVLASLCGTLARFTATPDDCFFGVWEGYGWEVAEVLGPAPVFALPGRSYLLLRGPLAAATSIGYWPRPDWFLAQSPTLMWPDDHAWLVATEIDNDSTLIGGSAEVIAAVLANPDLEARSVSPRETRAGWGRTSG